LEIFQATASQNLNVNEYVSMGALSDDKAIALGAVEPLNLGVFQRPLRRSGLLAAWRLQRMAVWEPAIIGMMIGSARSSAHLSTMVVPVRRSPSRPIQGSGAVGPRRGAFIVMDGAGLIKIHDLRHLPTFGTLYDIADDQRAFQSRVATGAPQRSDMQENVAKTGLACIIGYDEAIALPRVKPFDAPADSNGIIGRFPTLKLVVRHLAPQPQPFSFSERPWLAYSGPTYAKTSTRHEGAELNSCAADVCLNRGLGEIWPRVEDSVW
jgi:hypothetical protein